MSEKRIYHSRPKFATKEQKAQMKVFGITNQEKYVRLPCEIVLRYCRRVKEHYVYSAFTTAEFVILDCPELKEYQCSQNLEGRYIPMMKDKHKLNEEVEEEYTDDILIDSEIIDIEL